MQQINGLSGILNQHFKWNKAKMDCFCGMLIGLAKARSINLTKIANAYPSTLGPGSRYRRMRRFIYGCPINFDRVAWFMMALFDFLNERFYITLDRANWQCTQGHRGRNEYQHVGIGPGLQRRGGSGLFRFLKVGEQLIIKDARKVTGAEACLSALRLGGGTLLVIASSELIQQPVEAYARRWEVETLFGCLI